MLREFKDFALKGNVVDLAIAVIIGGAFGTIVSSLVDDVVTPLLLTPALKAANAQDLDKLAWGAVKYGKFIAAVIKFIIIAFILFLLVKMMNNLKKKDQAAPVATPEDIILLREIRDALKK
ncbi:MAG: Large-conductance mechanosensitive channel [Chitinophagaceae bacterium]|nr:Large-conductance mechanosensitive channel [Chitinophagaceae bacterium]